MPDLDRANEPHDDQVQAWSEEFTSSLSEWLRDFEDYDDKIYFQDALQREIKAATEAAYQAGFNRGVECTEAAREILS